MALALHDTANFILTLIRIYAPVDTGWLRDSYQKESETSLRIIIGTMVNYAIFQEYGTSQGHRFTPHLRPAFMQSQAEMQKNMISRAKSLG